MHNNYTFLKQNTYLIPKETEGLKNKLLTYPK
jgi:hypothetical protein